MSEEHITALPIERFDITPLPEHSVIAFQIRCLGTVPPENDSRLYCMTPLQARILVQVIEESLRVMQAATASHSPGPQRH